jgi:hypothetical protein
MKKLLLVPVLLFAACAETPKHDVDQLNAEGDATEPAGPATPAPDAPESELLAFITQEPSECHLNTVRLLARYSYPGGVVPDNVSCQFTLLDGTVIADSCFTVLAAPTDTSVRLTVTDLATGAVAVVDEGVRGPDNFTTSLAVSSDGLSLSWDGHTNYGGVLDVGSYRISISPSENVIAPDPSVFGQLAGTVSVTEPGRYTVTLNGSITFGEHGGCGSTSEATIEMVCPPGEHDHEH